MKPDWGMALEELEMILQKTARRSSLITYGELTPQISSISMVPNSPELASLLCRRQVLDSEGSLPLSTSLVVGQRTGRPGRGFFALAAAYFRFQDPEVFWLEEVSSCHASTGASKIERHHSYESTERQRIEQRTVGSEPMTDQKEFILSFFD